MHGLQKFLLFNVLTCLGQIGQGSKIINGENAAKTKMLYMASLQSNSGHVCGGFLIAEDFVLTAAHCGDYHPTHVFLGNHNLKEGNRENISITENFKRESYKNLSYGEDIMLLKLSTKAQLSERVQLIKIPSAEIKLAENEICQVAGWGLTENKVRPNNLKVANVSVINLQVCKRNWGSLPSNVICAGGCVTKTGFCQGDSGGPLVCNGLAVGVVSFNRHKNCIYPNVPNVYTDISKYLQWINSTMNHTKIFV